MTELRNDYVADALETAVSLPDLADRARTASIAENLCAYARSVLEFRPDKQETFVSGTASGLSDPAADAVRVALVSIARDMKKNERTQVTDGDGVIVDGAVADVARLLRELLKELGFSGVRIKSLLAAQTMRAHRAKRP